MTSDNFNTTITTDPKADLRAEDLGAVLKQSREKQSLSVVQLANELHLSVSIIEALEQNRFDVIPVPAYIRGYIRNYAKVTGLNEQGLIEQFNRLDIKEPEFQSSLTKISDPQIFALLRPKQLIWAFSLAAMSAMVWWTLQPNDNPDWLVQLTDEEIPAAETLMLAPGSTPPQPQHATFQTSNGDPQTGPFLTLPLDSIAGGLNLAPGEGQLMLTDGFGTLSQSEPADGFDVAITDIPLGSISIGSDPASENKPGEAAGNQSAISSAGTTGTVDQLQLSYNHNSWTEIRDFENKLLLHGLVATGETRLLEGKAPFSVFLGNSPGVDLSINGHEFDQTRYNRSNNTARFSVNNPALY